MNLPYVTRALPGVGGLLKSRPEDFFVQEIPLYEPCGDGEHVFFEIQKTGLTTFGAVERLAQALGVSSREIGYAGLKDCRAVTRQVLSVRGVPPERVRSLRLEGIEVLWVDRHTNKLRLGHLAGNRFVIRLRQVNPVDVLRARQIVQELHRRGMPNYFGDQRFGRRRDNHLLGACLIRGRPEELLRRLLGTPDAGLDDPQEFLARKLFDENDLEQSLRSWPRRAGLERRTLARLIRTGRAGSAVRSIDPKLRRLWISALQSAMFNQAVARRIDRLDRLMPGDLAFKHDNGACFAVTDPPAEQPRADRFEISPTGPVFGYRMTLPEGEVLTIEQEILKSHGLTIGHFRQDGRDRAKGTRRPLRVQPRDLQVAGGVDEHGPHITLAFTLPPGSYATVLLREVMKNDDSALLTTEESVASEPSV
ncbi:MAG: tRNA pseudouridine(13) synthase TruD, partial [Phycisphaerae bacterium]|nr:tRNA pseudouridine(13) synthase TruD [Phycisphaerae bacterium]